MRCFGDVVLTKCMVHLPRSMCANTTDFLTQLVRCFDDTDLGLSFPKMIDMAMPANMVCGIQDHVAMSAV